EHDLAYKRSNSITERIKADFVFENRTWERFKAKDSSFREKASAWAVTTGMKAIRKLWAGCGFNVVGNATKTILKKNIVIPMPKTGGMLSLIPIFAGLSALSSLTAVAAVVAKTVIEFNRTSPTHLGKGLYLAPHKSGSYKITSGN
ncbi:Hypothetical protein CINCED_3A000988, partial [Cinara cedri]